LQTLRCGPRAGVGIRSRSVGGSGSTVDEFSLAVGVQRHATATQERNAHLLERDELQARRSNLLQTHYAGAVTIDLLKSEQDRIDRRLAFLEAQIEAGEVEFEHTRAHIEDCLALAVIAMPST